MGDVKLTGEQKEILLNFMEDHTAFAKGQLLGPEGKKMRSSLWAVLAEQLNSCGGPTKSTSKWQRAWIDLKNKIKRKAGEIRVHQTGTGGGPRSRQVLTEFETRVVGFLTTEGVHGLEGDVPLDSAPVITTPVEVTEGSTNELSVPSRSTQPAEDDLPMTVSCVPGPSSQSAQGLTWQLISVPSTSKTSSQECDLPLGSLSGLSSPTGQMFSPSTSRSSSAASQHSTPTSKKSKTTKKTTAEDAYKKFAATAIELNQHVAAISQCLNDVSECMSQTMTGLLEERRKTNNLIARQNELLLQLLENLKK